MGVRVRVGVGARVRVGFRVGVEVRVGLRVGVEVRVGSGLGLGSGSGFALTLTLTGGSGGTDRYASRSDSARCLTAPTMATTSTSWLGRGRG